MTATTRPAPVTVTLRSPEHGWDPFLQWLEAEHLDPHLVKAITFHADGSATAWILALNDDGHFIIDNGEARVTELDLPVLSSPPPLHPSRTRTC